MSEHLRFLEALKLHGKNWKAIEEHIATRTSTQARSHAQKVFGNIQKSNMTMEQYLDSVSLERIEEIKSKIAQKGGITHKKRSSKRGNEGEQDQSLEDFDNWELLMIHTSKKDRVGSEVHSSRPSMEESINFKRRRKLTFERKNPLFEDDEEEIKEEIVPIGEVLAEQKIHLQLF